MLLAFASVWTVIVFMAGLVVGAWLNTRTTKRIPPPMTHEERIEKIKRTRPSLRNPMRPYDTRYDDFRTKRDLYAPVKPSGKPSKDELEA